MQRQKTNSKNFKGRTVWYVLFYLYIMLVFCPTMRFDVGDTKLMEQVLREGKVYWTPGLNGDLLFSMDRDGKIEAQTSFGDRWSKE